MFARNQWYVAAWNHEVGRTPLARTICNEEIVLYRMKNGGAAALADRCWHRHAPLSLGRVTADGVIQCTYHGLTFDASGQCTSVPGSENVPPGACVKAYSVAVRHGFVWVWIGDAGLADENSIPDLHWNTDANWVGEGGHIQLHCDYRLLIDRLMDLTHESYVHSANLGDENLLSTPIETEAHADHVIMRRVLRNHQPAPFWKKAIVNALNMDADCDRWQIVRYTPPSTVIIDVGAAITGTGAPDSDRSHGVCGFSLNGVTPESERSTHYFWNFVRNFDLENRGLTFETQAALGGAFAEDVAILEGQQRASDHSPTLELNDLDFDAGKAHARRLLDDMVSN